VVAVVVLVLSPTLLPAVEGVLVVVPCVVLAFVFSRFGQPRRPASIGEVVQIDVSRGIGTDVHVGDEIRQRILLSEPHIQDVVDFDLQIDHVRKAQGATNHAIK